MQYTQQKTVTRLRTLRQTMQEREHKIIPRILILPFAHNQNSLHLCLTATTIPCVSQKRVLGPYNKTFSRLESCLRSFASGSLTAAATSILKQMLLSGWLIHCTISAIGISQLVD